MPACSTTSEPRPYALPPVASLADRVILPPCALIGALTTMDSPASAVRPTPDLTILMALLNVMRCKACKVTLLCAPEMVPALMVELPVAGASPNWSKFSSWPLELDITSIS